MKEQRIIKHIINWLKNYSKESSTKGFVIGISGCIDSAVTSVLAAKTNLPLICLEMPILQQKEHKKRSKEHIDFLKKEYPNVRSVEVSFGGWDTHQNNFTSIPELCHTMDKAVAALLDDLKRVGKLDDTVVVLTTEFGRTPKINQNVGRDHYPQAFTSVLAGGGFKGGYIHGKTSEGAEEVIEGSMTIPDFNATIAHALGIPVDHVLYSPTVRPFTVAHKGKPQLELFA